MPPAASAVVSSPLRTAPPRPVTTTARVELVLSAAIAIRQAAQPHALAFDTITHWCAERGGPDPRLEQAALRHGFAVVDLARVVDDVTDALRARLAAAAPLLGALAAAGELPRLLAAIGHDDVQPPADALVRALPPRIARFYWQRVRAYVAWAAARNWQP
jgi:hypothetical protein